ncbi:hypothetical protein OsccyDRAFT_0941 [Leptolyngbyaceae cyanobacterium JSC-12]|nr:hypothetical protein OsccyDRAFT_0941 [Leptolyngbyaceae cyanobacterium JSC-12]
MTSPFLDAARQGRNGWKSYLFGTILLLVAPTFVFFILYIFLFIILSIIYPPFGETVQQGGDISKFFQSYLYKKYMASLTLPYSSVASMQCYSQLL